MTKKIIWGVIILIALFLAFRSCYNIDITRKLTVKDLVSQGLDNLGVLNGKVDVLSADVDTIKVDIHELKNRKGPTTIWRTKTVVVPQTGQLSGEQVYDNTPARQSTEQSKTTPQIGTITSGSSNPGPQDLLFCIDLEPAKSSDASKKFLFWELINNEGYSISNIVSNFTGKSANMLLAPGASVDGISYNGEILKISVSSIGNWYAQIMSVPMPSDFRPAIRSNKSGWSSRPMTRSGEYFVYLF